MTYQITSQCISCNICLSACPVGAIKMIDEHPWIDPNICTNCVDTIYTVPQCKASCPTYNGCVKQPSDYWESWFATYDKLIAKLTNQQDYWDRWFDCYSQKFLLSNKIKCLSDKGFKVYSLKCCYAPVLSGVKFFLPLARKKWT